MKKTMFVIALVFCLLAAMTTAFAVSGKGTQDNPFRLSTPEELLLLADFPACHFELEKDITFSGTWEPVENFTGSLDGKGHTVKISSLTAKTNTGFFGTLSGTIKNLTIHSNGITISSSPSNLGLFAGVCSGTIENCKATGKFTYTGTSHSKIHIGGICGDVSGKISNTMAQFDSISLGTNSYGKTSTIYIYAGGICGNLSGTVNQCANRSSIILKSAYYVPSYTYYYYHLYYGGISGTTTAKAMISDSFNLESSITNTGNCTYYGGISPSNVGTITNCYSAGGNASTNGKYGIANGGTKKNCFYDKVLANDSQTSYGTPKSTLAMKMEMTYTDWDFENIWAIDESEENPINGGYPYLRTFYADVVHPITVSTASVSGEHIVIDTKITDVADTYVLHIALYDADGRLCDYMMLPNDRLLKDVFAVFADDGTATSAKVFVWDALNVIEPTADCETILITRE